jgi:hypothetical protein
MNFATQAKNAEMLAQADRHLVFKSMETNFRLTQYTHYFKGGNMFKKGLFAGNRTDFSVFRVSRRHLCNGKRQQAQRQIYLSQGLQGLHATRRSRFSPNRPSARTPKPRPSGRSTFDSKDFDSISVASRNGTPCPTRT